MPVVTVERPPTDSLLVLAVPVASKALAALVLLEMVASGLVVAVAAAVAQAARAVSQGHRPPALVVLVVITPLGLVAGPERLAMAVTARSAAAVLAL
jgi:hypothetical protein